jgi:hypothetical protein
MPIQYVKLFQNVKNSCGNWLRYSAVFAFLFGRKGYNLPNTEVCSLGFVKIAVPVIY